jgi:putative transposase
VSKKPKSSRNREKAKLRLAKLHEKTSNQRNDFQHQFSSKLIRENQAIAVETLNVNGMLKNHCLAQAISDSSWSRFVTKLKYKTEWFGKNLLKIDRFGQ